MSVARAVTATFAKFRLTVTTAGVGAGTVRGPGITCVRPAAVGRDCTETYAARAVVRLTASPLPAPASPAGAGPARAPTTARSR